MTGNSVDPFTGITENGLTVTPSGPNWLKSFTVFGNPSPFITTDGLEVWLDVTRGGGLFRFTSVDLQDFTRDTFNNPSRYAIDGLLGGSVVFSLLGSLPNSSNWVAISSGSAMDILVDTVRVTLRRSAQDPTLATLRGLDNIVVADVPEPASLGMLTAGLAAIALRRRRSARTKA
ncbi:MAG: PEP-CTERM sorting domain-containing protein [Bryobacterales bacterium]|nr:PEP-CTERM sorting domain-containing protein [Bryobacterales bacterium]